jgi:hypothetical protein
MKDPSKFTKVSSITSNCFLLRSNYSTWFAPFLLLPNI